MSTPRWFYAQEDNRLGPVAVEQIAQLVMKGEIPRNALVWRHGLSDWTEATRIPEIASMLPPPLPVGGKGARTVEADTPKTSSEGDARREEIRGRLEANPRRYAQVADDLRKEGDFTNAIWVCREGLERYAYPSLRLTLARALLESGDVATARGELETVLQAAPDNIVARRLHGECLRALGEPEAAPAAESTPTAPARTPAPPRASPPPPPAAPAEVAPAAGEAPKPKRRRSLFGGVASVLFPEPSPPAPAPPATTPPREPAPPTPEADPLGSLVSEAEPEPPAIVFEPDSVPPPARPAKRNKPPADVVPADLPDLETLQAPPKAAKAIDRGAQERLKQAAEPSPAATGEAPPRAAPRPTVAWPSGRLSDHEFPDLVREVYARRWTGILNLNQMGAEKRIRVQDGRLVFASSSIPDDRLGELLLRRGRITIHQYVEAGHAIHKGGKRLGTILVGMGALDARELVKVVVDHTLEIIYGAFQWTEGTYHFTESAAVPEDIVLKLSTPEIILEGIRRIDRWSRIERAVGGLDTRYERAAGYQTLVPQMMLSPDKMALLTDLTAADDLDTICRRSSLPHFEICRTLWAYRVIGAVRRLD